MTVILFALLFIGILIAVAARADKQAVEDALSHWHQSLEGVTCTPREFYDRVRARLESEQIPGLTIKIVAWREGGIQTDKRDYLRITRGDYSFDLCAATLGNNFFVSSWLSNTNPGILETFSVVPGLGWFCRLLLRMFSPMTYFRVDSAAMFHDAVHTAVLTEMDEMAAISGSTPIPETLRRPQLAELYATR